MSVDEAARHDLYVGVEEILGPDRAGTLMSMLPPVGWADVATKHDLEREAAILRTEMAALGARLEHRIDGVEHRLTASFEGALRHQAMLMLGGFLTTFATLVTILVTLMSRLP